MKRSLALLLSALMVICCVPSSLMTVLAVDPSFTPNGIRNQTFEDAYNQYIPETVTVDGVLDDTAWAYEDWNKVSTETGTWNKDIEEIGVNVYDYNYQYQFKTDYEYFYGAIKLNRQFYGDFVIWLNDGRWEYCTDRIVINPTKLNLYGEDGALTAYSEGAKLNETALKDAVRLERNVTSVLDVSNTLGGTTNETGLYVYEKNGAGAYIPAMRVPSATYDPTATVSNGKASDWISLWDDVNGYSYSAEKTQYVIKQDETGAIIIEFRIYAYAFEHGKIEQDGSVQAEDYNPNYTYYVSAGVSSGADYYNEAGYYAKPTYESDGVTQQTKTKTYYADTNGTLADAANESGRGKYYVYTDCYYTDNGTYYRAALYYPRLNVTDDSARANYIPSINYWPNTKDTSVGALSGLKPEVMEMTDTPANDDSSLIDGVSDSQMNVDGIFAEDIWSPLTNYHVNGDQATNLDLSRVLYSVSDETNDAIKGQNAFKMELRVDGDWLYGAALAYVPSGGSIMPKLTIWFSGSDSNLTGDTYLYINANNVTYADSYVQVGTAGNDGSKTVKNNSDEFWALRKKNDTTQLWQFEFKVKIDGNIPIKTNTDGKKYFAFNATLKTDKVSETDVKVGKNAKIDTKRYFIDNNYCGTYENEVLTSPEKSLTCKIDNVIWDGKVDEYDWAALCAFDNVVSGQYQDDYVHVSGSSTNGSAADGLTGGGNPNGYEDKITTTNGRDMASFYKLTSDGEYLYGGVLVQFGEGDNDYWRTASRPAGYSVSNASDYESAILSSGKDIDFYRIWINNNPEHTNSLEREGATSVINIAVINFNGEYEAYLFVGSNSDSSVVRSDALARIPQDKIITDSNGNLKGFALEFRVSLYAIDLKGTKDNGVFMSNGANVLGTYDINYNGTYYYNDRENSGNGGPYAVYYVDSDDTDTTPEMAVYENGFAGGTDANGTVYGPISVAKGGVTVYYDGSVNYITLDAYEGKMTVDANFTGNKYSYGDALPTGVTYAFHEFNYSAYNKTEKVWNHVDYTQGTYFCYFVTIENAKDVQTISGNVGTQDNEFSLEYGRLISVRSEDPLAVDAWTGHVYATYQNSADKKWWRRNFFNVHIAHSFGYNDMLEYCVVDGKLDEHMWHKDDVDGNTVGMMTYVTPTTGVWETTPTQNEVFEYTYRVWTDGNYVYGAAWLNKEIVKGMNENDSENCTKLELYFRNTNTGTNYYFDMYFRDDDEIVGTYQINGDTANATITGGLTDMLYQKTITYANKECYFEFRIDLSMLGCSFTQTAKYDNFYLNRTGRTDADTWNTSYSNYTSQYDYSNIQYHIGITQPCQTGAAYEVLTLFADNTSGDPYNKTYSDGKIVWGTLNTAIKTANLDADYTTATKPSIGTWDASDAMRVDQMEHFAGEKIRVDGTLNDTGWAEHRWLDVDKDVNGSEDEIYDDLSSLNYKYMVRSDKDWIYVAAVIDVEFNETTKPSFYFWVLNDENDNPVDYVKIGYGNTTGTYYPEKRSFTNSELYDVFDVDDFKPVFNGGSATYSALTAGDLTELASRGVYGGVDYVNFYNENYINSLPSYYYEEADNTFTYDGSDDEGTITFNQVEITTSAGIDPAKAGLYGYSEVVQEMNNYFDIVNYGQVVGKEHALMQSANGVMINDTAGKKDQTVVEFRVAKSAIDPNGDGFKYAVQASATFNNQEYDLVYPYVDNKVGENREMDDYNFPNQETIDVWQENAVTVNDSTYERYNLRNNTNSVVTLGAKANISTTAYGGFYDDGIADNNSIRFGGMYTENNIRNNVYNHTVDVDSLSKDGYDENGNSNVAISTEFENENNESVSNTKAYWYWDATKLGTIILPTWKLSSGEDLNLYADPSLAYVPARSIVTWKGDYSVDRNINFADYESFQYYSTIPDIPDQYTWIKYSFAAINGFDYVERTCETDIGNGENYIVTTANGSDVDYNGDGKYEVEGDVIYEGYGVTVNFYYDEVLERSPYMINLITKGTEEDGDDSSNEESALPDNMDEGDYNGTKVAYIPLDNRPVNVERVQYLAEASGFDLVMPEEDFYRTATLNQKANSNGTKYGDQKALLTWLRELEDSEDVNYYIISLDQIFFGGLAEAASATGREGTGDLASFENAELTDLDIQIIKYLGELADSNYVYYYTSVTPTVGLEGYAKSEKSAAWWADDTFRTNVSNFTEVAHQSVEIDSTNLVEKTDIDQSVDISGNSVSITLNKDAANTELQKVFGSYFLDADGNALDLDVGNVSDARKYQILNTRKIKMLLITEMLASIEYGAIEHLVFGIEDVYSNSSVKIENTIQVNEVVYIQACVDALNDATGKENYHLVKGVDHLGLAGISALTTDLYATQIPYFGNEDTKNDDVPKVTKADGTSLLWEGGAREGIDVKVEYITTTASPSSIKDTYTTENSAYDELINSYIELAGGRRVTEDKSAYLANATLVFLVIPEVTDQSIANFVARAIAHFNVNTPVAMVAFGGYQQVALAMEGKINGSVEGYTNAIDNPGRFMGTYTYNGYAEFKYRSTNSNMIGIPISNAISRYAYLTGKRQTVESHEGAYKVIGYSLINDISYSGNFNMDMDGEIYEGVHENIAYDSDGKFAATKHYSGLVKYGVVEHNLEKSYAPQEIMALVNKSKITVKINVDWNAGVEDGVDAIRYQDMADIMIGNARNPLDRPHELTFDVAVVENNADNVARNKNDEGVYIRNRNAYTGTYFYEFYEYYYDEFLKAAYTGSGATRTYDLSGYDYVPGIPTGYSGVTLPDTTSVVANSPASDPTSPYYTYNKEDWYTKASESQYGYYYDANGTKTYFDQGALNYVISVTNDYYADNERDSVVNYKFSYGAELTDGLAYNYLEYTGKTHDERETTKISPFTLGSGYSNNGWFAFEKDYNCHYAGNDKYFGYVVVDLKEMSDIGAVRLHLLNYDAAEVHEPAEIRLLVSENGTHFNYVDSFYTRDDSVSIDGYWSMLDAKGVRGRYVKIEVVMGGQYALLNEIEVYSQDTQTIRVGTYNLAAGKTAQANAVDLGVGKTSSDYTWDTVDYHANIRALCNASIEYFAEDIREADLDVVFLQEIALNTDGYIVTNGFDDLNMIQAIAKQAGFKYVYLNRASYRTDVSAPNITQSTYANDTDLGDYNFHKVSGSAILSKYPINEEASNVVTVTEGPGYYNSSNPQTTIMTSYYTTVAEHPSLGGTPAKNYNIIVLDIPANGGTMQVPVFSAHCNPQNLETNIIPYLIDDSTGEFYDNLIVAGDFNNPTFNNLIKAFPGMNLTVNDTNKLITYYQGKSMDNIIYSSDDYSIVASGTVQSGNSDHYLVWAELEYYEWVD